MTQETRTPVSGTGGPATAGRPLGAILESLPLADRIHLDHTGESCPAGWAGDDDWLREEYVRARAVGDTVRIVELVTMMARQDYLTSTTYPRSSSPAHPESTLDTVPDHTQPEPPVLIPQHGSTGGRKPYNVRLRLDLVAEAMDRPEFAGKSLAQVIELALERLLP